MDCQPTSPYKENMDLDALYKDARRRFNAGGKAVAAVEARQVRVLKDARDRVEALNNQQKRDDKERARSEKLQAKERAANEKKAEKARKQLEEMEKLRDTHLATAKGKLQDARDQNPAAASDAIYTALTVAELRAVVFANQGAAKEFVPVLKKTALIELAAAANIVADVAPDTAPAALVGREVFEMQVDEVPIECGNWTVLETVTRPAVLGATRSSARLANRA